ncbi:hypothetical protein [Paracoccus sp. Ld10]|uniref:hypothetical protein n=1 Tax=Paracoccus sp. Ld10 TaxID=649158 RepID=UPI003863EE9E
MAHHQAAGQARGARQQRAVPAQVVDASSRVLAGSLTFLVLAGGMLAAGQAGAANFTPPAGCTLNVTVQNRNCTVSQYYTCSADPDGYQHSAHFGREGLYHLSTIDAETRWIESQSMGSGLIDRLVEEAEDHASFSELLSTGRDDFDFWTETDDGQRLHHQGADTLTGETVTIDGQTLERTQFRLTTRDAGGEVLITREGNQHVSRDFKRFYGGVETSSDWTGAETQTDDSPVLFTFPGEAGFGSTTPQFDCDQLLTQIPQERAAS